MKRDSKRSVAMIVVLVLIMQLIMPSVKAVTFAETKNSLTVSLNEIVTGTAPFNTSNQIGEGYYPGDDFSATDQYVRTLDSVAYTIDYGVNPAGTTANNVVLKANLSGSNAITWDSNLEILYSGLTISADGKDITYNLGNVSGGNAYSFSPVLKVDGTALNGETFHLDVTLSSDNIDPVTVKSEDVIISASPKFDLAIDTYSKKSVKNASNVLGTVIYSTIEVLMDDGKGSEYITGDLNFTVDLSKIRALGINPEIYDSADANEEAVERHGDSSYIHWYGKMPWGNNGGNSESSVVDTATFNATQAVVGEDINITVSNADLSGNHLPSKNADGSTVALDENYVVAGTLAIWIPATQTPETDTTIEIGYKDFDPDSISGQSNYKTEVEPIHNNQSNIIIKRPTSASGASKSYYYGDVWYSYEDGEKLYGETNKFDNTGLLLRGETFDTRLKFGIASDGAHTNVATVVKLDSDIELLADGAGIAHTIEAVNGLPASEVIVEYGVGEYTDWLDMRECEGEDADSLGAWYTDVNSAPSEITKIRVRSKTGEMPSNSNIYVIFKTKVKDTATLNAELPVFLSYKTDMKDSGRWRHSYYDLDTGLPNSEYRSDNANVTGVKSQIEVAIDKVSEQVGNKVNITLESSLTAKGKTGNANDVIIEVNLPNGLEYRLGSAKQDGLNSSDPIVKRNSDNSQTLTWNLGEKEINEVMDSYSFDADISYEVASLSDLAVVAVISTPLDVSKESLRSSQDSVIITNTSAWGISKSVESPIVEVGEDLKYTLKYFQFRNEALKNFEFIDVLPYIGDGRAPASNFHGSYSLKSINVTNGETYMVTNADPSTISIDPNVAGTPWFAYGDIANDEVTAIKIFSSSYPHTEPTRTIDIILTPVGNQKNDVYTNIFSGRTEDILALVESNDVSIRVIASSISGTIWEDTDSDGSIDPTEDRLSNVTVALVDNLDKEVSVGVTNADGTYTFENIPSGQYKVKIKSISSDYEETFEHDGSLNEVVTVDLAKDIGMTGINFGYQKEKEL